MRRDTPKGRESGIPEVEVWQGFFDPVHILDRLDCVRPGNVVEFGCGYGLFNIEAARKAVAANVQLMERDFVTDGTSLPNRSCDYAMVFNLLRIDEPVALLREAFRPICRRRRRV